MQPANQAGQSNGNTNYYLDVGSSVLNEDLIFVSHHAWKVLWKVHDCFFPDPS
jgi:hypothetical protein